MFKLELLCAALSHPRATRLVASSGGAPCTHRMRSGRLPFCDAILWMRWHHVATQDDIRGDAWCALPKLVHRQSGIQSGIHYPIPCHLQPAFQYLGYKKGDFPHAETLSNQILSLPIFPGITKSQIELVCQHLSDWV